MKLARWLITASAASLLAACAGPQLQDYAGSTPAFDLRHFFDGDLRAQGLLKDRSGRVTRRFVVAIHCEWHGDEGTLDEQFHYDDGEQQHRVWHVRAVPGGFEGRADDVVGIARGTESGSAFNWRYTLRVPARGSVYELQFDDWMHRIDASTVLNTAQLTFYGLHVGEVVLSFQHL
jgi:hypothetical protein